MKYVGVTKFSKLSAENDKKKEEEKEDMAQYIQISDEADAIMEEIKKGFERLRVSTLMRK